MTIKDCIDIVDSNKPNQYTITDKVRWLSFIDEKIINDVLKTHEGYDGRYDDFTGYSDDKLSVTLIAPSPYDRLYTQYLKMKIDEENGETARYNNSATLFNSYYLEYKKYYNKLHKPLSNSSSECNSNIKTNCKAVTDAELESLKNELSFILKNYFADTISDDKVNDVVTKYMQNNTELFKGKDGKTPIKGQDYFTDADIKEIMDDLTEFAKDEVQSMSRDFEDDLLTIKTIANQAFREVKNGLPKKVDKISGMGLSEMNYTANDQQMIYDNNRQIATLKHNMTYKVDAVPGKGLSSNDYTPEDKALLYETKTQMSGKVDKVFGKGLSTEDYTTEDKALLYETKMQMSGKVDKEFGKGLSENNYSNEDKTFVSNLKNGGIATKEYVLKNTSNTLENVVKGNAIRIDDVSPNKHTIQVMARGKNLFGLIGRSEMSFGEFDSASKRTFTGKGIYYAVSGSNYYKAASAKITDNNNSIKINTTDAWYGVGIDIKVRPSTTYTLSGDIPKGSYIAISQYDSEGEHIGYTHYNSNSTFVTSSQTSWILAIMVNETANSESIFTNIQLEEGDVASYYKQYINPATITVKRLKKNLIPYPYAEKTTTKNGINFVVSENGIIKATGRPEETTSFGVSIKNNGGLYLIKGQSYFFSCVTSNSSLDSYYAYVSDANGDNYFDTGKGVVVTPQLSGYASVYIVVKKGVNLSSVVYKPMLEVGTTKSGFEKYDIENIGLNESGIINVDSLSPTITFLVTNPFIDIEASYNQDINVTIKLGEQNEQIIHEIQKRQFKKVAHGKEVTLTDSCYSNLENLTLYGRTTQSGTPSYSSSVPLVSIGDKGSITVQVGNESESQTLKIPIRVPLYGLPVSSDGNFVDSDGKQWLCNVIDLAKGVYIQKVALEEVVFSSFGTHQNGIPYGVVNLPLKTRTHSIGMLCERARYVSSQGVVADTFYENVSNCVFNGSDGENSADVTAKYEGCKIMYALKNEVVLPLSSEITELFRNIHTYKPTTNIKNDALAHMDVEYYVDIPAYVGNQIAKIPTGGGGSSELPIIYSTTLTEAVSTISLTQDMDGNNLSLTKWDIFMYVPSTDITDPLTVYVEVPSHYGAALAFVANDKSAVNTGRYRKVNDTFTLIEETPYQGPPKKYYMRKEMNKPPITKIDFKTYNANTPMPIGTFLEVRGR